MREECSHGRKYASECLIVTDTITLQHLRYEVLSGIFMIRVFRCVLAVFLSFKFPKVLVNFFTVLIIFA
jgi:hypothetical protein